MKIIANLLAAAACLALSASAAPAAPACDPGNGGITLPPGFCAAVVADGVGHARHLVVMPNGDLYVALLKEGGSPGGVVGLHDGDGDGKYETRLVITTGSATGVGVYNGYLYVAHPNSVERFRLKPGELQPAGGAETVVAGLEGERQHGDKGLTFDGKGSLYVNVGAPSNACQQKDRSKGSPGMDPCPILERHGGIWKFDATRLGQTQDTGTRFATGLRQMPAITWHQGALYIVMNNRDQLDVLWPEHFTAEQNATLPAEPMYRASEGSNFGWPYCFYDFTQQKLVENPEYGGDGKIVGRCSQFTPPVAAFPAHWAPVDVMFYGGSQFPARYRQGAFIAFHGSWNRAPLEMTGYNVTFQPFADGRPAGGYEVFASGFAGKGPIYSQNSAEYRPDGVAEGPDGSLYISESVKGRIWRVVYTGAR